MIGYQDSCAPAAEVSFPAAVVRDVQVARWLRERRLAIDVRTIAELHAAISVGIHPLLMTVHADRLDLADLRRASAAGVGRLVLSDPGQVSSLPRKRPQNVMLRRAVGAPMGGCDVAAEAVIGRRCTTLIGLVCEIGCTTGDFGAVGASISDLIAQMKRIRHRHNVVLTRLILGVGDFGLGTESRPACGGIVRRDLAEQIDESLDDACAALRFPRPVIVLSA
ncbi:LysA protein [Mycobacterium sp. shizuoka-1]|nr:LysA protein [Mycobacterium sp. shizuoka-1]